jgi:hypothetical protein
MNAIVEVKLGVNSSRVVSQPHLGVELAILGISWVPPVFAKKKKKKGISIEISLFN